MQDVTQPDVGVDSVVEVAAPNGETARFLVQVKRMGRGNAASAAVAARNAGARMGLPAIVFTDYANPALRRAAADNGVGYADEAGWVSLRHDGPPGLLISTPGALRAPGPTREATMRRLDGPAASRVIRAIWKVNRRPQGVRELAVQAGVSPGTVAKVLPALAAYGAVDRDVAGRVAGRSRWLLLERWTQDYHFETSNLDVQWFLAPRGIQAVTAKIRRLPPSTNIKSTGSLGARNALPGTLLSVTPLTLFAYYTSAPARVAEFCGLVPIDQRSAANVVLATPRDLTDPDLLQPLNGGMETAVPLSRLLADLMTMGGRYPQEAQQLFEALKLDDRPVGRST